MYLVVEVLVSLFWVVYLYLATWEWRRTYRFHDGFRWRDIWDMGRYGLRTTKRHVFLLAITVPVAFVWLTFRLEVEHSPLVWISLVLVVGASIAWNVRPAGILMLTSSRPESAWLFLHLQSRTAGVRLVGLLEPTEVPSSSRQSFSLNNLRTRDDRVWQSVVHPLMDRVPLLIVDTRFVTPAVLHEITRALDPSRIGKAVFVVAPDRSAPGLDAAAPGLSRDGLCLATEEELPELLSTLCSANHPRRGGRSMSECARIVLQGMEYDGQSLPASIQASDGRVEAFQLVEFPRDGLLSCCYHRAEVRSFLPRTDFVVLIGLDGPPCEIRWENLAHLAGDRLNRVPGIEPERWELRDFPDDQDLIAIRRLAWQPS